MYSNATQGDTNKNLVSNNIINMYLSAQNRTPSFLSEQWDIFFFHSKIVIGFYVKVMKPVAVEMVIQDSSAIQIH